LRFRMPGFVLRDSAMMESPSLSPAAERMRRHRQRRQNGLRCLTIELREREIDALISGRFLKHEARNDRNAIINALYRLLDQMLS
jgi:hypothetical protein